VSNNFSFAILFPILAVICISAFAGSLGVIFMLLEHSALEENGVIILGSALVILVPLGAYMLERNSERG
jgi:hypothetical protein